MSERYLVTGGAGFIGSNVVAELLARGHQVRVLDNFSTGRRENLATFASEVELFEGDLRSYERVHNAVRGVDYVVHLGALPSVPRSVQDPLATNSVNVTGTLNVLLTARDEGVRRVVFASSSSIYGRNEELPKHEAMVPMPISPYAVSKLAGEQSCLAFHVVYGMETVALRYFNVFGPRQDPNSQYSAVIPRFIRLVSAGERPRVFGDGMQTRDFTFVGNVVEATLSAVAAADCAGEVMNVACGESHTLLDLLAVIGGYLGREVDPIHEPARPGDIHDSFANVAKAERLLGYRSTVSFEDGVERTIRHLLGEDFGGSECDSPAA